MRLTPATPLPWLLLVTALFTFLIQSGELGTSDTTHRLQVAHSLWTSEPQIFPYEYPEAGLRGRNGKLYAQWGIGQSLLMLPADLLGAAASRLPLWRGYVLSQSDPTVRDIVVSIATNLIVNVLTALAAFRLLALLGFSTRESIAGTLGLLIATTHLHYAQNMTENNCILLLTLTGFGLQYKWLLTGNRTALLWGSAALGFNLLTRLTTALDILGAACFLLLAACFTQPRPPLRQTAAAYLRHALPIYAVFLFLDRLYQYLRFGSWTTTYMGVLAQQYRQRNPTLPANFPFSGGWLRNGIYGGLLGPFLSPGKSIFLFDPLFLLVLLLTLLLWKELTAPIRAFLLSTYLLLLAYVLFYARFIWWPGDDAWGDRYLSSVAELAAMLAVPLLLRYRSTLARPILALGLALTAASALIQTASLAFWVPLELYQRDTFGPQTCILLLRFKNIAAFALGKQRAWGLLTPTMFSDPWDYAHINTWNFLPALLRHIGVAPLWAVNILYAVWAAVALALIFSSIKLFCALRIHNLHPPD